VTLLVVVSVLVVVAIIATVALVRMSYGASDNPDASSTPAIGFVNPSYSKGATGFSIELTDPDTYMDLDDADAFSE
jgi:hypothetical protein